MIRAFVAFWLTAALWVAAQAQFFNPMIPPQAGGPAPAIGTVTDQLSASNTSGTTLTKSPASNIAAGSLIVICVQDKGATSGGIGVLSDPNSLVVPVAAQASPNGANTNGRSAIFYVLSSGAVTTADSFTYGKIGGGSAAVITMISATYTGTLSVDINATPTTGFSNGGSQMIPAVGNATPTGTDLFVACAGIDPRAAADTFTQATGWSTGPDAVSSTGGGTGLIGGHIIIGTPQKYNPTITSRAWAAFLLAFKAS